MAIRLPWWRGLRNRILRIHSPSAHLLGRCWCQGNVAATAPEPPVCAAYSCRRRVAPDQTWWCRAHSHPKGLEVVAGVPPPRGSNAPAPPDYED